VLLVVSLLHRATIGAEILASCSGSYGRGPSLDRFCWKYWSMAGMLRPPSLEEVPVQCGKLGSSRVGEQFTTKMEVCGRRVTTDQALTLRFRRSGPDFQ